MIKMKVRWRELEMVVAICALASAAILLYRAAYSPGALDAIPAYTAAFAQEGAVFDYVKNAVAPRLAAVFLLFGVYAAVNLWVLPLLRKINFSDLDELRLKPLVKALLAIVSVSYLFALGVNEISHHAKPWLFSYDHYRILALLGYNDAPLRDLFFGFERALGVVSLFVLPAILREIIIYYIERPKGNTEFRVLVANNIAPLLVLFFAALFILNPVHEDFLTYVAFVTPVLALYVYTTFWLFPQKGDGSWLQARILGPLSAAIFIGTLPQGFYIFDDQPYRYLRYGAFLLFIATPVSWLLYQQRKDKILQLKGMESALAKSTADLQFLRTQINPHFLFNAMNTLYGTALNEGSENTATGIQKLGDMMRFMLHENNLDAIPMEKEIAYLKNYVDLQILRTQTSPDIVIEHNIETVKCPRAIAPMLLIPFVENAFKHGISLKEKSWIKIHLECKAGGLEFEVENSIHPTLNDPEKERSGIGLKNVAERLRLLYPGKHRLQIDKNDSRFHIKLTIND
jgi:two-component system, LytTR family, sensor kinase